ncbi:unnamed protein product [Urochloa humidicola]
MRDVAAAGPSPRHPPMARRKADSARGTHPSIQDVGTGDARARRRQPPTPTRTTTRSCRTHGRVEHTDRAITWAGSCSTKCSNARTGRKMLKGF